MSATARFYLGFGIALIIVVAIAFFIGYRVGAAHAPHASKSAPVALAPSHTHAAPTPAAARVASAVGRL